MRKLFSASLVVAVLAGLSLGLVGCAEETGSKEEIKIKTPTGTSTETRDVTVKKSGDNPPAVPSDAAKP